MPEAKATAEAEMFGMLMVVMIATVLVLIAGVLLMMKGGDANRKYGNKLMMARVAMQGLAVLMVGLLLVMKSAH